MSTEIEAVFAEWSLPPWLTVAIVLTAWVYVRGWLAIRKTRIEQFTSWRLSCFLLGLAALWTAIASPLDGFADKLLSAHMVQHLLLMSIVPPLLLLGWPVVPLLKGSPRWIRKLVIAPLLRTPVLRRFGRWCTSPLVAWIAMNLIFLGWHVPAAYDFALTHENWHEFEHACFLTSSLAFWFCIVRPWPSRSRWNRWGLLPYLLSADLVNTVLSAFLAFCDRPVYTYYVNHPNPFDVSPLSDQVTGAVIMWVCGSCVFLVSATLIAFRLLQTPATQVADTQAAHGQPATKGNVLYSHR
jgi:putative membrane protein